MSESKSNSEKIGEISIPAYVIDELFENLPEKLAEMTLKLGKKENINQEKYLEDLLNISEKKRRYAINALMYFTNDNNVAEEILLLLIDHSSGIIIEKILISLTHRKNKKFQEKVKKLENYPDEIIRAASIWSLAYMGVKSNLFERIKERFSNSKSDRSKLYFIVALYHLNKNPKSREMQFLKKIFLTEYYDEENEEFIVRFNPDNSTSSELLCNILWEVGIKIVKTRYGESLEYFKYLLEAIR